MTAQTCEDVLLDRLAKLASDMHDLQEEKGRLDKALAAALDRHPWRSPHIDRLKWLVIGLAGGWFWREGWHLLRGLL
jgi:hypothetical protein